MKFSEWLRKEGACDSAVAWVGSKSFESAWTECVESGWMSWAVYQLGHRGLVAEEALVIVGSEHNSTFSPSRSTTCFRDSSWRQACFIEPWALELSDEENIRRCSWLRAQMQPYLPKRMRFE